MNVTFSDIIMPGIFGESTCPQEEDMKRNQIDTDLGAAIKEGIILNNMTQKQLAKALHISQQTLSCYIHNQRTPNIHDLVAISQILSMDIYVLLGLKKDIPDHLDHIIYKNIMKLDHKGKKMVYDYVERLLKYSCPH